MSIINRLKNINIFLSRKLISLEEVDPSSNDYFIINQFYQFAQVS